MLLSSINQLDTGMFTAPCAGLWPRGDYKSPDRILPGEPAATLGSLTHRVLLSQITSSMCGSKTYCLHENAAAYDESEDAHVCDVLGLSGLIDRKGLQDFAGFMLLRASATWQVQC